MDWTIVALDDQREVLVVEQCDEAVSFFPDHNIQRRVLVVTALVTEALVAALFVGISSFVVRAGDPSWSSPDSVPIVLISHAEAETRSSVRIRQKRREEMGPAKIL
jgi:hypothetical protein